MKRLALGRFDVLIGLIAAAAALHAVIYGVAALKDGDFNIIWAGWHKFTEGDTPYLLQAVAEQPPGPYLHPPGSLLALGWLGRLPENWAGLIYLTVAGIATPFSLAWWYRTCRIPTTLWLAALAIVAYSLPYDQALLFGNLDALVIALLAVGLTATVRDRKVPAVLLLAIAATIKPTAALVLLAPALAGRWRITVSALVGSAFASLIGFAIVPESGRFFSEVLPFLRNLQPYRDVNGAVAGIPSTLGAPHGTAAVALVAITALCFAAITWLFRRTLKNDLPAATALMSVGGLLIPNYSFVGYQIYLALAVPFVVRARRVRELSVAAFALYFVAGKDVWRSHVSFADNILSLRTVAGNLAVATLIVLLLHRRAAPG